MSEPHTTSGWPQPYRLLDAAPYWEALQREELTFQRCGACAAAVWPAHGFCTRCGAAELRWERSAGRATVWSFSTVMRGPTPTWQAIAPYTVGFVELEEGYFLFTQIEGDPASIRIGLPVAVRFIRRGEQTLPVFAAAGPPPA